MNCWAFAVRKHVCPYEIAPASKARVEAALRSAGLRTSFKTGVGLIDPSWPKAQQTGRIAETERRCTEYEIVEKIEAGLICLK